jgi:hypothetical protein
MKAKYAAWNEAADGVGRQYTFKKSAGYKNYVKVFKKTNKSFKKQLTHLNFNLGSERYGSEYFVDICYRATQIEYPSNVGLAYLIKRQVTITDLGTNGNGTDGFVFNGNSTPTYYTSRTYQNLAELEVKSALYCRDKNNDLVVSEESNWKDFSVAQLVGFSNKWTHTDLKGCLVRYKFRETNINGRDSLRRWKLQEARICTYTSVNEDE